MHFDITNMELELHTQNLPIDSPLDFLFISKKKKGKPDSINEKNIYNASTYKKNVVPTHTICNFFGKKEMDSHL